ncbi:MAG: hypothetical protein EHM43_05595 [Ignavibacteriae bacterium]|jgi:hypothetical protein|nr:MAG: hypothetical protein EHM43_05595 [Ignavibacteriota bacterium]
MKSNLLVAVLFLISIRLQAQPRVDGELMIGPSLATIGGGETIERFGGVAVGASANVHLMEYGLGFLAFTLMPNLTFGASDNASVDLQRFQIPIGLTLTIGDDVYDGAASIGGGVTMGYGFTIGSFTDANPDLRPFVNFDVSFGIFERGALKLRYSTVFGEYQFVDRGNVNYHALFLVGSTSW